MQQPASAAELTHQRHELSAALHGSNRPGDVDEEAVERLLLVYEEMVSNALRHGGPPVNVTLLRAGRFWLLDVADAATDVPPVPAVHRDAADGGLGLYLIARLTAEHGWNVDGRCKHLWARIDYTRADDRPLTRRD